MSAPHLPPYLACFDFRFSDPTKAFSAWSDGAPPASRGATFPLPFPRRRSLPFLAETLRSSSLVPSVALNWGAVGSSA